MKILYVLLFLISINWHCQNASPRPEAKLFDMSSAKLTDRAFLLVFKEEQTLELWAATETEEYLHLSTFPIAADANTPVGVFTLPQTFDEQGYQIPFPNDFYLEKQVNFLAIQPIFLSTQDNLPGYVLQLTEPAWASLTSQIVNFQQIHVLIFPNDARKSGNLSPCMHCPYWMAEVYSQLYAYLQQFMNKPTF